MNTTNLLYLLTFNVLFLVLAWLVPFASFPHSYDAAVRLYDIFFAAQDNVHHASLTVRQTLQFAAKLRMSNTVTAEDREKRVAAMVTMLGLEGVCVGGFLLTCIERGRNGGSIHEHPRMIQRVE